MTFLGLPADVDEKPVIGGEQRTRTRQASRVAARDRAEVSWKDDLEVPHKETVNLVNASARGLAFPAHSAFKPGHQIAVRTERYTLDCVVRHVQEAGSCRCVGVEASAGLQAERYFERR